MYRLVGGGAQAITYARLMVDQHYYKTVRISGDWPTIAVHVARERGYIGHEEQIPETPDVIRVDFVRTPYMMEQARIYKCSAAAAIELVALPNWHSRLDEPERPPELSASYVPDFAVPLA